MTNAASEWAKVLIHPLGLSGYALFLLFGWLARAKRRDERRWLAPAALLAAGVALIGGLMLAHEDIDHKAKAVAESQPTPGPSRITTQQNNDVRQTSSGPGSPNIQGVQGDVSIVIDQSSGDRAGTPPAPRPARSSQNATR